MKNKNQEQIIRDKRALIIQGYTEKEADDIIQAMQEDKNLSRFTDPSVVVIKKKQT